MEAAMESGQRDHKLRCGQRFAKGAAVVVACVGRSGCKRARLCLFSFSLFSLFFFRNLLCVSRGMAPTPSKARAKKASGGWLSPTTVMMAVLGVCVAIGIALFFKWGPEDYIKRFFPPSRERKAEANAASRPAVMTEKKTHYELGEQREGARQNRRQDLGRKEKVQWVGGKK
jgi:hypothetical protein